MSALFYDGVDHMIEKITTLIKGKANNSHKHTKNDITDFPILGTASSKDVASSGNASATQVVMGNDTRLSDARKASDVYAWAKASTKPTYTKSEVGLTNVDNTSDTSKPVSTAQQTAIDAAYTNANKYTDKKVAELIGSAPETMDTLEEVAAAIQENKDVETALNEAIGKKANQVELDTHVNNTTIHITASERANYHTAYEHSQAKHARADATKVEKSTINGNILIDGVEYNVYSHPGNGTNPHGTTKSDVGLGNVGNFKAVSAVANQGLTDDEKAAARANIGAQIAGSYASSTHNHDDKYQAKGSYASASHTHDDRYYTESEMNTKLGGKVDLSADGVSNAINKLSVGESVPSDADYYISQFAGGGTTTTSYHRRPVSALWNYIKSKADSVYSALGHTHTKSQITDFPTSMPANGGNSTTVNGYTVNADVPSGAKFTDTTYTSKSAVPGGTDLSLVTTGEKATWHAKTSNIGTITEIKMNGASKGTSGVVDLGTVLTGGSQTSTSDEDGGENVYTFSDGSTITIKNGTRGDAGTGGSDRLTYYETRPTSANKASSSDRIGSIEAFVASSKMTTGKPSADAKILQMNWDNTSGWDSQLAMINSGTLQHRNMSNGTWQSWKTVLDSSNYSEQMRLEKAFSWTPNFYRDKTHAIGTNVAYGVYYKIGKLVYIRGYIVLQESSPCFSIKGIPLAISVDVSIPLKNLLSVSISKSDSNVLNVGDAGITEIKNKGYNVSDEGVNWIIEGWYVTS